MTEKIPFYKMGNEMAIRKQVIDGQYPPRPEVLPSDELWNLIQDCWEQEYTTQILERLANPLIGGTPALATVLDWDETFSSRFRRSLQGRQLLPSVAELEHRLFGDGEL